MVLKTRKAPAAKLAKYLKHAAELYSLATKFPGSYQDANPKSCLGTHGVWPTKPWPRCRMH